MNIYLEYCFITGNVREKKGQWWDNNGQDVTEYEPWSTMAWS
jgi:hypothetical protein